MSHSTLSINGSNNFLGNSKQGLKKKKQFLEINIDLK